MKTLRDGGVVEELRGRLQSLEAGDEHRWGVMMVAEMVCHVQGAFQLVNGSRRSELVASPLPKPMVRSTALWMPMRWPKGLPTVAGLHREELVTTGFPMGKAGLLREYEGFLQRRGERPEHPSLGVMTERDWMRWGFLHTDHHLRQFGR